MSAESSLSFGFAGEFGGCPIVACQAGYTLFSCGGLTGRAMGRATKDDRLVTGGASVGTAGGRSVGRCGVPTRARR
jgi:hypothetical protein